MTDLIHLGIGDAGLVAVLGYAVVFVGLILLMCVVTIMGRIMVKNSKKAAAPATAPAVETIPEPVKEKAPGTAGDLKLYNTEPKDAAMIMAIVADSLGKPLNELRFISIKEVKEDEV